MTPHACPPVNDCQPDPLGTLAKSHAFPEGAARCDCGKLPNVDDHAAIVQAARAVCERVFKVYNADYIRQCLTSEPESLLALVKLLADLLPSVDEVKG